MQLNMVQGGGPGPLPAPPPYFARKQVYRRRTASLRVHFGVQVFLFSCLSTTDNKTFMSMVQWFNGLFLPLYIKKYIIIYNVHRIKEKKSGEKDHKRP